MILAYIEKALAHAWYEIIEDRDPYYGEVPELAGVWATGPTHRRVPEKPHRWLDRDPAQTRTPDSPLLKTVPSMMS